MRSTEGTLFYSSFTIQSSVSHGAFVVRGGTRVYLASKALINPADSFEKRLRMTRMRPICADQSPRAIRVNPFH